MPVPGPLYMNKEEQLSLANDDHAIVREQGNRLAGSYVNFYMGKSLSSFQHSMIQTIKSI